MPARPSSPIWRAISGALRRSAITAAATAASRLTSCWMRRSARFSTSLPSCDVTGGLGSSAGLSSAYRAWPAL